MPEALDEGEISPDILHLWKLQEAGLFPLIAFLLLSEEAADAARDDLRPSSLWIERRLGFHN